jgi:ankyrin repeat protein
MTDAHGNPLMAVAAIHDAAEIVQVLVENGIDVNAVDTEGRTAVHLAAQRDS